MSKYDSFWCSGFQWMSLWRSDKFLSTLSVYSMCALSRDAIVLCLWYLIMWSCQSLTSILLQDTIEHLWCLKSWLPCSYFFYSFFLSRFIFWKMSQTALFSFVMEPINQTDVYRHGLSDHYISAYMCKNINFEAEDFGECPQKDVIIYTERQQKLIRATLTKIHCIKINHIY